MCTRRTLHAWSALRKWQANEANPRLAQFAKHYLSAPSRSVSSEHLFSSAGKRHIDRRTRLDPEHEKILLFIRNTCKPSLENN